MGNRNFLAVVLLNHYYTGYPILLIALLTLRLDWR